METKINVQQFWNAIRILLYNYHAVNRKIFACLIEDIFEVEDGFPADFSNALEFGESLKRRTESELRETLDNPSKHFRGFIIKQKFLTKKLQENITAYSLVDFSASKYTCKFADNNLDDFLVSLHDDGDVQFKSLTQKTALETNDRWLQYLLKPKLLNWALSAPSKPSTKSLQLVDVEAYNNLYKSLKSKHAEKLKKIWLEANESTDPLKFIYEDLAIAAYLISLWQSENSRPPTAFADLGCGNGLLVYVLNQEGYAGFGYDIRQRKLWSLYPATLQSRLFEAAIVPFQFSLPAEVDVIIGNHSDELSPWIPILAALERYEMSYFLLPCCAFELSGAKFQRRNAKMSTYQDFLVYARELSARAGFSTLEDRLKIPSTKRLALVGFKRNYEQLQHALRCEQLRAYVEMEMQRFRHASAAVEGEIKLREKHEIVRNCTKLDKSVLSCLELKIFRLLLEKTIIGEEEELDWKTGGRLTLKEIARSLTAKELQQIKSECGGIKTLLRNKHEVFEFLGNDLISIRKPQKRERPKTVKRRTCFFNKNHPDGCPLLEVDCSFLHD